MSEAKEVLKRFIKGQQKWPMLTGTIKAVDGELCDVDPSDGGPTIFSVRIKPAVNNNEYGVIAYPKVKSPCVIGELDGDPNKYVLLQCEQIDHMLIKMAGGSSIELKAGGVVNINGDDHKGLVKVDDLRQDLAKVNAILQAIQTAFQSWVPVDGDSGVSLLKTMSSQFTGLQRPTYQTIESQKTKHGSA